MSRDQWWLDFVEDKLDKATRSEMKSILRNSPRDQELVKAISDTKTLIQSFAEPLPADLEASLEGLHDKIMAGIERTEIKAKPKVRLRPTQKKLLKSISVSVAFLLAALALTRSLSNKSLNTQWDVPQQMAFHAQENPDEWSQMMSYQSEHDFFVDVAGLSLDHLTSEQFEDFLSSSQTR